MYFITSANALSLLNKWKGQHRAAYWRELGFPNCERARAAWRRQRHELLLEQWKREELRRSPFVLLNDPPSFEELASRFKVSYRRRVKRIYRPQLGLMSKELESEEQVYRSRLKPKREERTRWRSPGR
jgi:hypothetical protein